MRYVVVDGHVHFHSKFEADAFLSAAHANLLRGGTGGEEGEVTPVLLMTDGDEAGFQQLKANLESGRSSTWTGEGGSEPEALHARSGDGRYLLIIAGRQIRCERRMEVLALCTCSEFEEGRSVRETLRAVADAGAVPVLPWGFGKWKGARGKIVEQIIEADDLPPFLVGDNGNRLSFAPQSYLIQAAVRRGYANLPGSDPLNFRHEQERVGTSYCLFESALDRERPVTHLRSLLLDGASGRANVVQGTHLFRFLQYQVSIQLRRLIRS